MSPVRTIFVPSPARVMQVRSHETAHVHQQVVANNGIGLKDLTAKQNARLDNILVAMP